MYNYISIEQSSHNLLVRISICILAKYQYIGHKTEPSCRHSESPKAIVNAEVRLAI